MRAAFAEYAGKLPVESGALRETLADVQSAMTSGGAVLGFVNGAAVASARYVVEEDGLYVGRVSVLPEFRRRGVASELMRFLEQVARSLNQPQIRIGVRNSLPSNIALYQSLGYATIRIDPHPGGADRSWTMIKRLSDP
jgi:ribosomal protein S18 acetylase RimI-like enzyme